MAGHGDEESAWATDDVPVLPAPEVIRWDSSIDSDDDAPPAPHHTTTSRRRPAIALALVSLVGAGLIVTQFGMGDSPAGDLEATANITPTSLDTLPATDAEERPSTDASVADPPSEDAAVSVDTAARVDSISISAELASLAGPTEIVALTTDSRLLTISLPSGSVRSVDIDTGDQREFFGRAVASPDATLLSSFDGGLFVVPRVGSPVVVDPAQLGNVDTGTTRVQIEPIGWVRDPSGATLFLVIEYGSSDGRPRTLLVDASGEATPPAGGADSFPFTAITASGDHIINDAGGAYRIGTDGLVERITTGAVLAASSDGFVLVRQCDETLTCTSTVQRIDGSETRDVTVPSEVTSVFNRATLSPGATALSYDVFSNDGERHIVDLVTGERSEFALDGQPAGVSWARDGSGQFAVHAQAGISYTDRATGDVVVFGANLGSLTTLDVRYPDAELAPDGSP